MSALRLCLVAIVAVLAGCAQPRPTCVPPPKAQPPTVGVANAQPTHSLHELVWQLVSGETGRVESVSEGLHSVTVGRWECALGEVEARDVLHEELLVLARSRRVACTHASGATVQSELSCGYRSPAVGEAAGPETRMLTLTLDTMPALRLGCEAREVQTLTLRTAQSAGPTVCRSARGWQTCPPPEAR